jgi:hypothetical protein
MQIPWDVNKKMNAYFVSLFHSLENETLKQDSNQFHEVHLRVVIRVFFIILILSDGIISPQSFNLMRKLW